MSVFHKAIFRFNAIAMKTATIFFAKMGQHILKFIWPVMRPLAENTMLKKKNKVRRLILPNFKIYYNSTVIKIVW